MPKRGGRVPAHDARNQEEARQNESKRAQEMTLVHVAKWFTLPLAGESDAIAAGEG